MDAGIATVIVGILVFIPATLSAVASMRTKRDLKTNNGQRTGHYIETTAVAVLDQAVTLDHHSKKLDLLEIQMREHLASDEAQFLIVRRKLDKQDELATALKNTLEQSLQEGRES